LVGILIIVAVAASLMVLERLFPDQPLPRVQGWWLRVVLVNLAQLGILILAMHTWERWLQGRSLCGLKAVTGPAMGGLLAYVINTLIFYWWHRARHDVNWLWLSCHQFHHSPRRIETITSFYKHPLEILVNSILMSILLYPVLGLALAASIWLTALSGIAELLYHMNLRTPRWLGYLFQRPEMHRIHHERGRHYLNFSDLPLWDMLFGTFSNPARMDRPCGFRPEREQQVKAMLLFRNVNGPYRKSWRK
jgi:sterol desaturase/sphingolipid hydroxylase (fatty acid hydroxylase superfamily)